VSGFDLSNFLASFFDEARERLSSIDQALVKFEAGDLTEDGMVALRRDAHTIKGSALMLGVTDIGETAHLFEDMMEHLMAHPSWRNVPEMVQFLYDIHDALDDRLKNTDTKALIDVAPLRANQRKLLEDMDALVAETAAVTKNRVDSQASGQPVAVKEKTNVIDMSRALNTKSVTSDDDDINTIDISMDDDLSDLNDWFHLDGVSLDDETPVLDLDDDVLDDGISEGVVSTDATVDNTHAKAIAQTPVDTGQSGLIGSDEAEAWKKKKKAMLEAEKTAEHRGNQTSAADAPEDTDVGKEHSSMNASPVVFAEAASNEMQLQQEDLAAKALLFRPNIDQIEMNKTAQRKSSGRFLRVDAERLDSLSNQVIELSIQQSKGEDFITQFTRLSKDFESLQSNFKKLSQASDKMDTETTKQHFDELHHSFEKQVRQQRRFIEDVRFSNIRNEYMMRDLRDQVLSLMLRPLDNIFSTFPRSIRDIAIRLNKRVRLVIGGKTLEMDQGVTESLVEPLVHLLNNAVAHGIESPEERLAAGKPEEGQVSIVAKQNGSEIRIEIVDDGRGLDTEVIKKSAVAKGVTTQAEADQMDSAEILEMIFRPGFTTKETVDHTSGRGIGMHVVQDTVRHLTGSIRIQSEVGKGTRFILSIPVSIAVQLALMFRMGNMRFGMLTHMVEQAIPYNAKRVQQGSDGREFIVYENYHVPIVDMRHVLGSSNELTNKKQGNIIIAAHIEGYVGIVVDEIFTDGEIVVRDLDPYIKRYNPQGLMGNTITADGSVVMLLEPYGIKEMGRTSPNQQLKIHVEEEDKLHFRILLVDDSLIAREVEKSIFESIGFEVDTAIDGLDGLEKLQVKNYDMVVTDLEMPRLDGFGFVRRIRNQSRYENLPLMIISTRESAEDRMRALESGADTYMVKQQLKGDEILQVVKSLIGKVPQA